MYEDFESHLKKRNYSKHTVRGYVYSIKQFHNFYSIKNICDINNEDIQAWRKYLEDKGNSIRTVAFKFEGLRSYLKFIYNEYGLTTALTNDEGKYLRIRIQKLKYRLKDIYYNKELSIREIRKMISAAREKGELRDELLMSLLFTTGIRISEALNIKSSEIVKDRIEILGKRNKVRSVNIPASIRKLARKYISSKKIKTKYLFTGKKGNNAILPQTADKIIKKYGRLAGIKKEKCFCHNFRHSYTIEEIKDGIDLNTIAEDLGIENIETLKIYQNRDEKAVRDRTNRRGRKL